MREAENSDEETEFEEQAVDDFEPVVEVRDVFHRIPRNSKCAAHDLQLVLKDVLEKTDSITDLKKVYLQFIVFYFRYISSEFSQL